MDGAQRGGGSVRLHMARRWQAWHHAREQPRASTRSGIVEAAGPVALVRGLAVRGKRLEWRKIGLVGTVL